MMPALSTVILQLLGFLLWDFVVMQGASGAKELVCPESNEAPSTTYDDLYQLCQVVAEWEKDVGQNCACQMSHPAPIEAYHCETVVRISTYPTITNPIMTPATTTTTTYDVAKTTDDDTTTTSVWTTSHSIETSPATSTTRPAPETSHSESTETRKVTTTQQNVFVTIPVPDIRYVSDNCTNDTEEGCAWIQETDEGCDLLTAWQVCNEHGAIIAVIPDNDTYEEIISGVSSKMPFTESLGVSHFEYIWVGTGFDVTYSNGTFQYTVDMYVEHIQSVIKIRRQDKSKHGTMNVSHSCKIGIAVVCWKPRISNDSFVSEIQDLMSSLYDTPSNQVNNAPPSECQFSMPTRERDAFISSTIPKNMTYADGERRCREKGFSILEIRNVEEFELLLDMARAKIPPNSFFISLWIKGEYDTENGLDEDTNIPFRRWYKGIPKVPRDGLNSTHLTLYEEKRKSSTFHGMVNRSPDDRVEGVICCEDYID